MTERSILVDKMLYHPRHDVATEILLLSHEAIRWDLEEMGRHLRDPYFTGQPQKVHIFFRWFETYFCELVKLSHARTLRLLSSLTAPSALPISSCDSSPMANSASGESADESLRPTVSSPAEQHEMLEKEMRAAERLMQAVLRAKAPLLSAQPDDRPALAEEMRVMVEELRVVLKRCMAVEEKGLVPWLRESVDPEDARAALEAEMGGDVPAMGWLGLSMWLPWIIHAMERWCTPKDVSDFREGLPWLVSGLTLYMWEPLYISSNWALLQSMADPLDEEDTADYDDDL